MAYIYMFKNKNEVIYVGYTGDIKNRLYQHFNIGHLPNECYSQVTSISYARCSSKNEAKIYEIYYISKFRPHFNSMFNERENNEISFELPKLHFVRFNFDEIKIGETKLNFMRTEENGIKMTTEVQKLLKELRRIAPMDDEEKKSYIKQVFTADVYNAFRVRGSVSERVINAFREASIMIHFYALEKYSQIADYEVCLKAIDCVTSKTNMYSFAYLIEALCDIDMFGKSRESTPTKQIFNELKKHVGKPLTKVEVDKILAAASKKLKVSKVADVKKVHKNYFEHVRSRTNKEKFTAIEVLTIGAVATKFGLSSKDIAETVERCTSENTISMKSTPQLKGEFLVSLKNRKEKIENELSVIGC